MASAKANKARSRKFPQDDFTMPLADALDLLLSAQDMATVSDTDQWVFHVNGPTLEITRSKVAENT